MSPKDSLLGEAPEVLIVENSPTQALKLRHLLAQQGFHAVSARNAREALAELDVRTPFLVLSDAALPEIDGYELCRQIKARPELRDIRVVLMASLSDPETILHLLECGTDNVLPKPFEDDVLTTRVNDIWATQRLRHTGTNAEIVSVIYRGEERVLPLEREHERLDMLLSLFEFGAQRELRLHQLRGTVDRQDEELRAATRAIDENLSVAPLPAVPGLRILLAEDSDVNQRLAVRTLEKHGHTVVVAADGRQALAVLERQPIDLVLMDVEMPEMNGLEATVAIRAREKGSGGHLPIIAMTAHTDPEAAQKCLLAGMDEYVSKPLQMETLTPLLARLPTPKSAADSAVAGRWDREAALANVEGDAELLAEIVGLFLEEAPRLEESIRSAISRQDSPALERAAHSLKGSAASLGAGEVVQVARALEDSGRTEQIADASNKLRVLEEALVNLTQILATQA